MYELSVICTCLGFQRRFDFGSALKTGEERVFKPEPTDGKHAVVFVLKKLCQHSMQRRGCITSCVSMTVFSKMNTIFLKFRQSTFGICRCIVKNIPSPLPPKHNASFYMRVTPYIMSTDV